MVSSLQSSGVFLSFQDTHSQLEDVVLSFSEDFVMTSLCVGCGPLVLSTFLFNSGQGLQQYIPEVYNPYWAHSAAINRRPSDSINHLASVGVRLGRD